MGQAYNVALEPVLSCPRVLNIHCLLVYTAEEIKWLPIIESLTDTLSSRFSTLY